MKNIILDLGYTDQGFDIQLLDYNETRNSLKITTYNNISYLDLVQWLDSEGNFNVNNYRTNIQFFNASADDLEKLLDHGYYSFDDFNIIIESFDGTKHFNKLCEIFQY